MKNQSYKIFILLLAILMIVGSLLWTKFSINRKEEQVVTNVQNEQFNQQHFNYIYLDTFVQLLNQAYPGIIQTKIVQNKLFVILENAGAITKDFFNGNDKLLAVSEQDYGFMIDYKQQANKIEATFVIKDQAVPVPNDVLVKLIDKNYNK